MLTSFHLWQDKGHSSILDVEASSAFFDKIVRQSMKKVKKSAEKWLYWRFVPAKAWYFCCIFWHKSHFIFSGRTDLVWRNIGSLRLHVLSVWTYLRFYKNSHFYTYTSFFHFFHNFDILSNPKTFQEAGRRPTQHKKNQFFYIRNKRPRSLNAVLSCSWM